MAETIPGARSVVTRTMWAGCVWTFKTGLRRLGARLWLAGFVGAAVVVCCTRALGEPSPAAAMQPRLEAIAKAAQGKVGVGVELLETKESVGLNGQKRFPMQSVYKFPIAMAVLHQVDAGGLTLEQRVQVTTNDFVSQKQHSPIRDAHPQGVSLSVSNLLQAMVSESDGSACDVLLRVLGGPASVDRYLRELGVTEVMVATTEQRIGQDDRAQYEDWATPEGMTKLLRLFHEGRGLSVSSRQLLLRFMTETGTGPKRIKGLLPAGTLVAHKTGSSTTVNGFTAATNDAGIVTLPDGRHLVIVVFVSDSVADQSAREAVIARIARLAWDHWAGSGPQNGLDRP